MVKKLLERQVIEGMTQYSLFSESLLGLDNARSDNIPKVTQDSGGLRGRGVRTNAQSKRDWSGHYEAADRLWRVCNGQAILEELRNGRHIAKPMRALPCPKLSIEPFPTTVCSTHSCCRPSGWEERRPKVSSQDPLEGK